MWLNNIKGKFEIIKLKNPDTAADEIVKSLQGSNFITEKNDKKISFKRSVKFSLDSGENRWLVLQYSYTGVINLSESNGKVLNDYSLNINQQLFKIILLGLFIWLFLSLFEVNINPLIYLGFLIAIILIHRTLIYDHFYKIVADLPQTVIDKTINSGDKLSPGLKINNET